MQIKYEKTKTMKNSTIFWNVLAIIILLVLYARLFYAVEKWNLLVLLSVSFTSVVFAAIEGTGKENSRFFVLFTPLVIIIYIFMWLVVKAIDSIECFNKFLDKKRR